MSRNDLALIIGLIMISMTPLTVGSKNNSAEIKVDGTTIKTLDLTVDKKIELEAGGGVNVIEIKDGAISVVDADCPDKICVRTGAINQAGEVIACVPHKLLIEIKS